jgi:hypothetical protein
MTPPPTASYAGEAVVAVLLRPAAWNGHVVLQVRTTSICPRSWASFSLLWLYSHPNAWANLHILGQPNTFLAQGWRGWGRGC